MKHVVSLGIEHLMTGVQLKSDGVITFEPQSASIVRAISDEPIICFWPVTGGRLESHQWQEIPKLKASRGTAQWYAVVMADAMKKAEQRSYDMQTYTRNVTHDHGDGLYGVGEPKYFPQAVVDAMRSKHGAAADEYLAKLRWSRDHWYYEQGGMYVGVEPDGYIHT